LKLRPEECAERDFLVFSACKRAGIPVVVVMGGGYSPRLADVVNAHCQTYRIGLAEYA
jgi:acetoin utilization deacetylase AcuC-like enzyme